MNKDPESFSKSLRWFFRSDLKSGLIAILFIFLCSSCSSASPATQLAASSTPTLTASEIPPTITLTSTPSPTSTPTLTLTPTPPPFALNPTNASDLFLIARLGHSQVESVSWSPDGHTLVVTADFLKLDYFDMQTFQLIRSVDVGNAINWLSCPSCGGASTVSAAFSPAGDTVASASGGNVILWDPLTGALLDRFQNPPEQVENIVFNPDGTLLAGNYGTSTHFIFIWNTRSRAIVHTLTDTDLGPFRTAFSPDGSLLVSVDIGGIIRLWDIKTGALVKKVTAPAQTWDVAFHPSGEYFVTGGNNDEIIVWDRQGNLLRRLHGDAASPLLNFISSIAFNPAGDLVAAGTINGKLQVFDFASGQQLQNLDGSDFPNKIASVAFSPDGQFLAAGAEVGSARVWATRALAARLPIPTPVGDPAIVSNYHSLPSGEYIAFSEGTGMQVLSSDGKFRGPLAPDFTGFPISADGRLLGYTAEQAASLDLLTGLKNSYSTGGFISPNGDWLASSGTCNNQAGITLTRSDRSESFCFSTGAPLPDESGILDEHITLLPWSPDGSQLAFLRVTATVPRSGPMPQWLPYATDGLYVIDAACLSKPDTCARSIRFAAHYPGKMSYWANVRWSPDGSHVVAGDYKKFVVFSLVSGTAWSVNINQKTDPYSFIDFAVSPDSRWILYSGNGTNILKQPINSNTFTEVANGLQNARVLGFVMGPLLKPDALFTILPLGDDLALRLDPGLASQAQARLHTGDRFTVLEGPVRLDGYTWWRIQPENSTTSGWVREFYAWFSLAQ